MRVRDLEFDYESTRTWRDNNEGLIAPFARSADGEKFQFLWEGMSDISPIISTFRGW